MHFDLKCYLMRRVIFIIWLSCYLFAKISVSCWNKYLIGNIMKQNLNDIYYAITFAEL